MLILITAFSCSRPPLAEHKASSPSAAQQPAEIRTGTVTYEIGDVTTKETSDWHPVTVGDSVAESTVVKTAKDSICEIQFGQIGIIHIAENTTLVLQTVVVTKVHKSTDLELLGGSVTAKVTKLAGDDHFQVRTDTVICGVRGTRFNIGKYVDDTTSVAVAEGAVALMPIAVNPVSLESANASLGQRELIADVATQVAGNSPVVGLNTDVVVSKDTMSKVNVAAAQLVTALASSANASAATGATRCFPLR